MERSTRDAVFGGELILYIYYFFDLVLGNSCVYSLLTLPSSLEFGSPAVANWRS